MTDPAGGPGRRLGDADFDSSPFPDLPRRRRARKEIRSWETDSEEGVVPVRRRRLTDAEREAIRARREALAPPPIPEPPPVKPPPEMAPEGPSDRGLAPRLVMLGLLLVVGATLIIIGSGRFFGGTEEPTPTDVPSGVPVIPTAAPTPTVGPTPTEEPAPTPGPTVSALTPYGARDGIKVVCLDPGHGGWDTGYTNGGMSEAEFTLAFAWDLERRLERQGIVVVLTHRTNVEVNASGTDVNGDGESSRTSGERRVRELDELQARIDVCNAAHADLLVSIHINGYPDASANGYEVWYTGVRPFSDRSQYFATRVHLELGRQFEAAGYEEARDRGVHDDLDADAPLNPHSFDNYIITGPAVPEVVEPSAMPGALVETLFISNADDADFLASDEGRDGIVTAYETAILDYFEEYPG